MESEGSAAISAPALRLLGRFAVLRGGVPLALPPSRKFRSLVAYLALAAQPVSRERLCDLLWDVPNDPRGELRWCLSRLRQLLDDAGRTRVVSDGDRVSLDLGDCDVDAARLVDGARAGFGTLAIDDLTALAAAGGELLDGMPCDGNSEFGHWLAGRRNEFRSLHVDAVAALASRTPPGSPDGLATARQWLESAPLDPQAHLRFLAELAQRRMFDQGEAHLRSTEHRFAGEDIDVAPLHAGWTQLRSTVPAAPETGFPSPGAPPPGAPQQPAAARRASIAVMPFRDMRPAGAANGLGDGLTHDVISRLARLRGLFVIARGSVFAIAADGLSIPEIGKRLGVDYVATGAIGSSGSALSVSVEVAEATTEHIVWTGSFETPSQEQFAVLEEIGNGIVSSVAAEIENAERNRALLKHPDSLDAWEAYHRGLWHMYRFTPEENARAALFFRRSMELDPSFSRAYTGLSFTHWQNAFQRWGDREAEIREALSTAGQSLLADDQNPGAHWSMGRALWLLGDHDQSVLELDRCVELSPNFALGHYSLSFVHSLAGDPAAAIHASDQSRLLSPCDPLLFGMLGTRAIALVRQEAFEEASEWALRAAARPNAHVHILAIAAYGLALAGRIEEARTYAARIAALNPGYRVQNLIDTFMFTPDTAALYRQAARMIGTD